MELLYFLQLAFSIILVLAVILSYVKDDYWVFRVLEYPRFQKFVATLVVLALWPFFFSREHKLDVYLIVLLGLCAIYLFYKIIPYTFFYPKEMKNVKNGKKEDQLKLFTANVLQFNKAYDKLIAQIESTDPDVIFLVETDENWDKAMQKLRDKYSYHLGEPRANTYGLLLFSRLRIEQPQVRHLVEEDVPSVDFILTLPSGQKVQVWGLHPKPPVPKENERSTAKDKELMKIAFMARDCKLPVVVMGDLNDVAWSYTTELFRKTSKLLDPRRGRGFFSTFSSKSLVIRFPLDYVFCSNDIGLVRMKRMPKNGSDHFAMFIHLQYDPSLKKEQETPKADQKEKEDAHEKASAST